MSTVVEQKVVEMRFDNKNFEQNVAQSMSTLDKLKEALTKSTSANAFDGLTKAANRLDLSGATSSVQKVTESFSVLEQIAIGALRRIGESIEEHLVSGLKSLTVGNVLSGWERYAQKTESTQTILSAIANDDKYGDDKLGYVEELLEKLAWFSDETSYNFTDMTDNISKFTAAGMDLDKSTDAMMGIATWAAMSGQNAQVASRAMYQLSQAMGTGVIKAIDWKSIEVANMATKEVKQMLIDYAYMSKSSALKLDELGYYVENVTKAGVEKIRVDNGTFRDTLQYGWLTAEAFSDAMGEYASYSNALYKIINNPANEGADLYASKLIRNIDNAQKKAEKTGQTIEEIMMIDYGIDVGDALEGVTELGIRAMKAAQQARTFQQAIDSVNDAASTKWATIFEKILGNVEEATVLYTDLAEYLYDIFIEPLNEVINTLSEWKKMGGRDLLLGYKDEEGETVNGALQNIGEAIVAIKEAIGSGIGEVFPATTAEQLYELTQRFKDFTEGLIISEETADKISKIFTRISNTFKSIGKGFVSVGKAVGNVFKSIFNSAKNVLGGTISDLFHNVTKLFYNLGVSIRKTFENFTVSDSVSAKFIKILEAIKVAIKAVSDIFGKFGDKVADFNRSGAFKKLAEFLGGKFLDILLWLPSKIADVIVWLDKFLREGDKLSKFTGGVGKAFTAVKDFFSGFVKSMLLADGLPGLINRIRTSISDWMTSIGDSKLFNKFADGVTNAFNAVKKFFSENLNAEGGAKAYTTVKDALKSFGETVSTAYAAVKEFFSNIDFEKIGDTLSRIGTTIADAFTKAYDAVKAFFGLFKSNKDSGAVGSKTTKSGFNVQKAALGGEFRPSFDSDAAKEGVIELGEKLTEIFRKAADASEDLATGIGNVKDKAKELTDQISNGTFIKSITDIWSAISAFVSDLFNGTNSLSDLASNGEDKSDIVKGIESFLGFILKIVDYLGDNLPALLAGGGLLALGVGISDFAEGFEKIAKGLKVFLKNVGWAASYWGKGEMFKGLGKLLLSIAGSIVILLLGLAGAIYLLNGVTKDTQTATSLKIITKSLIAIFIAVLAMIAVINSGGWKDNAAEAAKFTGVAMMVKGIAVALAVIAAAVVLMTKWLGGLTSAELENAEIIFASMMVFIALIGSVMALIAHAGRGGWAMVGTLAMILGVKILIDAVKGLYEYISDNVIDGNALRTAAVIVAGLIVLLEIMAGVTTSGQRSAKAAAVMLVAALTVSIMSAVLIEIAKAIKGINVAILYRSLAIISLLGIVLATLTGLIGDGKTAGQLAATAVLLGVAAGTIGVMYLILKDVTEMVAQSSAGEILAALGIVMALEALLSGFAGIASTFKDTKKLAITTAIFAGLAVIIWFLKEFVFKDIVEIVKNDPSAALYSALGIVISVMGLALALKIAGSEALESLKAAGAFIILAGALAILEFVIEQVVNLVNKDPGNALIAATSVILMVLILSGLLATFSELAPFMLIGAAALLVLAGALWLIEKVIEGLGPALVVLADSMVQIFTIIDENREPILGAIEVFWAAILLSIEGFLASLHLTALTLIHNLDEDIETIQDNIHGFFERLNQNIHQDIQDIIWNIDEDLNDIIDNVDGLINKILDNIGGPDGLINKILDHFVQNSSKFLTSGSDIVANVAEGIKENKERTHGAVRTTVMDTIDFWKTFIPDFLDALVDMIDTIAESIEQKAPEFWAACSRLAKAIWNAIWYPLKGGIDDEGSIANLGKNIASGLGEGISKGASLLEKVYIEPFRKIKEKIAGEFESHSPSKWAERLGVYIDEGLAEGLLKGLTEPMAASNILSGNIKDALGGQFDDIESLFSSDLNPTITPVMDLSEIQNGMTSMDSLFGEYDNLSLTSAMNSSYSPFTDANGESKVDIMSMLSGKFGSLEDKLDELLSKFTNLQVVLDSGELVGGLVDPMDDALGWKSIYAGRAMG